MSAGLTAVIVIAVVVVAALIAVAPMFGRRRRLQQRFGPEYERMVERSPSRQVAEQQLRARVERRRNVRLAALSPEQKETYRRQWDVVQAGFVDTPDRALIEADELIGRLVRDRGYPQSEDEERLAVLSVDHGRTLHSYRTAHEVALRARSGATSTEELRDAMVRARSLFHELVDGRADGGAGHGVDHMVDHDDDHAPAPAPASVKAKAKARTDGTSRADRHRDGHQEQLNRDDHRHTRSRSGLMDRLKPGRSTKTEEDAHAEHTAPKH